MRIPPIPEVRIQHLNQWPVDSSKDYILYWMNAFRRTRSNFALQHAVFLSEQLKKPLVIFEAVRCNYRWTCDRFHAFIIDGMHDNANAIEATNATYLAYVENETNQGHGLMETLSAHACVVVSDDFPCFFYPAMYQKIARNWKCKVELIDSNTVIPMRQADRTFTVAHSYRRYMQKVVFQSLPVFPVGDPLSFLTIPPIKKLSNTVTKTWNVFSGPKTEKQLNTIKLAALPIDHKIASNGEKGGPVAAAQVLNRFVNSRLSNYAEARNEPEQAGSSSLSPYLHFGNISPHEVYEGIVGATDWTHSKLSPPNGKMDGFWNMGTNAEAFMDQLLTWREIGFNLCWRERRYDRFESLPEWAQKTLQDHEHDKRPWIYDLEQFDSAATHDTLWNAAQNQLKREGRMHNYLRMLWGKKILHWSESPRQALSTMIELNNKYALDGRDPNSYSGIFWVLGRYDRAWGPERPVFGKIRYMTSESTQNKYHVKKYIAQYS